MPAFTLTTTGAVELYTAGNSPRWWRQLANADDLIERTQTPIVKSLP